MTLSQIAYIFPIMMIVAAISDLLTMRIPNRLNLLIAGLFVPVALLLSMPIEMIGWHLLAGLLVLMVGVGLFLTGKFGGGDAKLMAAGALWIGWQALPAFIIWTALTGGLLAIVWFVYRPIRLELEMRGATWLNKVLPVTPQLPYGIAIAGGAVLSFSVTWWFERITIAAAENIFAFG